MRPSSRSAVFRRALLAGALLLATLAAAPADDAVLLLPCGEGAAGEGRLPSGEIPGARRSAWLLARRGDDGRWRRLDWEALAAEGGWTELTERARQAAARQRGRAEPLPEAEAIEPEAVAGEPSSEGANGAEDAAAAALPALREVVRFEAPGVSALLADPEGLHAAWEDELGVEIVVLVGGADRFWLLPRLSPHRDEALQRWPGQDQSGWTAVPEVLLLDPRGLRVLEEPQGRRPAKAGR